ncbi:MAG: cupin domain-containing protein [Chloroflexota bacterium]
MNKKPIVVNSAECPWQTRESDYKMTEQGAVRWKTLLSSDQTDSHSITMGFVEFPPGEKLVRHRHPQVETYYILEGIGEIEIEGEIYSLTPGVAVFIPGNAVHELTNTGEEFLRLVYSFPVDRFSEVGYKYER